MHCAHKDRGVAMPTHFIKHTMGTHRGVCVCGCICVLSVRPCHRAKIQAHGKGAFSMLMLAGVDYL